MLINSEKLIGLKVETQNGTYLGRVQSFNIDIDIQEVRSYNIKPTLLARLLGRQEGGIFSDGFIIHHKQVVSISEEKMIVLDNVVKYKKESMAFAGGVVADT